jgi:hypothetical protein
MKPPLLIDLNLFMSDGEPLNKSFARSSTHFDRPAAAQSLQMFEGDANR